MSQLPQRVPSIGRDLFHCPTVPILSTKLKPRSPENSWVERRRLISRLEREATKRLTLISAPAGYGKSCLAAQWLYSSLRKFAWLSLDEHDDSPDVFVRYLIAALRRDVSGFGLELEQSISGLRLPPPRILADSFVRCLESLSEPIWLVLDDFHKINSAEVNTFVGRLLANLPATLRLVILTRKDPDWLRQRWVIQAWVSKMEAEDLSFSLQETQTFFRRSGTPLDKGAAEVIQDKLEGWVAGLQLAQLSGLTGGAHLDQRLRSAAKVGRFLGDFVVEEVVSHQPSEIQDFLAVSSLFDRFCAPLCDAALGKSAEEDYSSRIIKKLQHSKLFLVSLDSEGVWFRYHHLFSDVLRSLSCLRPSPEQLARIYSSAGRWLGQEKLIPEALQSFLAAGEVDTAVAFLEEHLHAVISADFSRRQLERLLKMFPPQAENTHPGLLVAHAWCDIVRLDAKRMAQRLDHAEELLRNPSSQIAEARRKNLQFDSASLRSFSCFWLGNAKAAVSFAARALQSTPRERHYARSMAALYAALGTTLSGRKESARKLIRDEMRADLEHGRRGLGQHLLGRLGIEIYTGNYDALKQVGHEMENAARTFLIPQFYVAFGIYFQGRAALERNDLNAATEYFSRMEEFRYQTLPRVYHDSLVGLALVAAARGDFEVAKEIACYARDWAVELQDCRLLLANDSLEARLAMLSSKEAAPVLRGIPPANAWVQMWLELPYLTELECSIVGATPKQCAKILPSIEQALRNARQFHNAPLIVQFLAVNALALWGAGRQKDGLRVLGQVLRLGEPRGFLRSFVDRAPLILELLQALLEKRPDDRYLHGIIRAHRRDSEGIRATKVKFNFRKGLEISARTGGSGVGLLSNREIDVLGKLADRLSNKEIAQLLFVSAETVKKHTLNIYRKLQVHNRREAIAAAIRAGLIYQTENPRNY